MNFIKKYWSFFIIIGLILYIIFYPKKVYKVVPKDNKKYENTISSLEDSINLLNFEKNKLLLANTVSQVETVTSTLPPIEKEKIVYKNEQIIQEVNCVDYYTDRKRDSLWTGNRFTKKNSSKR